MKEYIANCLKCIEFSPKYRKFEGFLHSISKSNEPFHTIHIDHYRPLEETKNGFKYVLSIIDAFTKFIELYTCKSMKTDEVIKHLNDYFRMYSVPKRAITDRRTCFTSNEFSEFMA